MNGAKLLAASVIALVAFAGLAGSSREVTHAEHPCVWPGVWGDANDDGTITSIDALLTLRAAAGYYVHSACGPYDVDCDHDIDSIDALKILRFLAGQRYSQFEPCPDIGTRTGGQ